LYGRKQRGRFFTALDLDSKGETMTEVASRYFSWGEAMALIGQRIRTSTEFSGVPAGMDGKVTRADSAGRDDGYTVAIQWELPGRANPLVDWFTRDEFYRYLDQLNH